MLGHLHHVIAQALPSDDTLQARLATLDAHDWTEAADHFSAALPEFGAVIALPSALHLAPLLSHARGVPTLNAQRGSWTGPSPVQTRPDNAILVTEH